MIEGRGRAAIVGGQMLYPTVDGESSRGAGLELSLGRGMGGVEGVGDWELCLPLQFLNDFFLIEFLSKINSALVVSEAHFLSGDLL